MLKRVVASFRLAHFSLLCIGLAWAWPFVYYVHAIPLTTFYQEWGAALLGLLAMLLLVTRSYWQQPEIPRIAMLPIGLLLLVIIQYAVGRIDYISHALLVALYLLLATLLVMLGRRLREELGLPLLVTVLAAALLLQAELNTVAGLMQHFQWRTFFSGIVLVNKTGVFGNLAQPNHFGNVVSLGLVSLGLLHNRRYLHSWLVVLLAVPMLFVLVYCGSRTIWMYLVCFAVLAFIWQRRDKTYRSLLYYSLWLVIGFALLHVTPYIPFLSGNGGGTSLDRAFTAQGGHIRLHIWHEAWLIFLKFPLLGAGFGQFTWEHFLLGPLLRDPGIMGIYNNAHNIVMQTAAEMGAAGLLIWGGALALWVRQAYRAERTIYHWWGYGVLAVLAIHSLLEFPLWYAHFLGVAALTLGALDKTTYRLELRNAGRWLLVMVLLLGAISLTQLWRSYRELESLAKPRVNSAASVEDLIDRLLEAQQRPLLQPYAEFSISNLMEGRLENLKDMRDMNERVMHFMPSSASVYREVALMAISGEQAAAQAQLERAIWAYPASFPSYLEQWRSFAQKDPAHFNALVEFAPKKYEEYQLAVRTR